MKIYFMRHGETDWNNEKKFQGRIDIPLNEDGKAVARLTQKGMSEIAFDVAFTSPLRRAKETAEIVLGDKEISIIEEERLIEVSFGILEGEIMDREVENIYNFFLRPEKYTAPEGGETLQEAMERAKKFLSELFQNEKYQNSTVLIATHGAMLSALLSVIKENSIENFWAGGLHKNCGVTVAEVIKGVPKILEEAIVYY